MKKQNQIMLLLGLLFIALAGYWLHGMKTHQRLGKPGIKTKVIPGSQRLEVYLPEKVLDYDSKIVPTDPGILEGLPHDTSFAQRRYYASEKDLERGDVVLLNIVLMGTDRTSIHKPQFCLTGSGWNIDDNTESETNSVHIEGPQPYDLPVMELIATRDLKKADGQVVKVRGIYVYWFVADHDMTASHWIRIRNTTTHLLSTGELERWAYVSCFRLCWPGQEEATYNSMKKFIAAAVPTLVPDSQTASRGPEQTAAR